MTKGLFSALAVSVAVVAAPVSASTVHLTFNGLSVTPAETVTITAPLNSTTVYAGGFDMTGPGGDFVAWCIDLFQHIRSADYTETRPGQVSDAEEADLNRLFTNNYAGALDSGVTSAAFQLAIWEIVYDGGNGYDLTSGTFTVSNVSSAVQNLATGWLNTLGTAAGSYVLDFYTSGRSQDLVSGSPSPVPVPAGLLLMGSGLGALALTRRRRKPA